MANQNQQKQTLADRLRRLLESLEKALWPTPQAPQPIPVRDEPRQTKR